jgi:hypothetical protein
MQVEHCTVAQLAAAPPRHIEGVLMVMPCTDAAMGQRAAQLAAQRARTVPGMVWVVHDTPRAGFVSVLNTVAALSRSDWIGYFAQDAFAGRDWLPLALQALQRQAGHFLGFNDGKWQGQLAAFGLARRAWLQGIYGGPVFYPGYHSHYGDAELTLVARQQGVYVYEPHSILVEVDWAKDQRTVHLPDKQLFRQRQASGFDGRVSHPGLLSLIG